MKKKRVVGTAGHIDHGKTSLVGALTGIDADRLPEEKRRGITIDLGFASLSTDDVQIGFVDVPGHERFVKNMLAGIGGIDSALLVVAADESVKPQTREHFAICRLLSIPTGVVAITKSDLVDADIVELVRLEVADLVAGSFLEGKPVIACSSRTGDGLGEIRQAIVDSVAGLPDRAVAERVFRLPIDRVFSMRGFGPVVTGTTLSGSITTDREVEVLPGGRRSRARSLQVHGETRERASAGERTSVNLPDIDLDDLRRGQQLLEPGTLAPSSVITVKIELLGDAKPLKEATRVRFHHLSSELLGSVRFVGTEDEALAAGAAAFARIRLESPVVAAAGDRFVIRRYSPAVTIGGGVIVAPHLPKLNRRTRAEFLEPFGGGDVALQLELLAKLGGMRGLTLAAAVAHTGWTRDRLTAEIRRSQQLHAAGPARWLHDDALVAFRKDAMTFLESYFRTNRTSAAVPKSEAVQKLLPRDADAALVTFALEELARQKIAEVRGDTLEIPGRSKTLGGAEGELARQIEAAFATAGLQPPAVSELIKSIPQKPKVIEGVIGFLVKQGALIRLAEGVYIHGAVLTQARERLSARRGETIDVAAFKEMFGLSRKIAIPLLERFDRDGVTKRIGDSRQVL